VCFIQVSTCIIVPFISDDGNNRAMPFSPSSTGGNMTQELCATMCNRYNFSISAVEFAFQCMYITTTTTLAYYQKANNITKYVSNNQSTTTIKPQQHATATNNNQYHNYQTSTILHTQLTPHRLLWK
jgi:hypothetical protein